MGWRDRRGERVARKTTDQRWVIGLAGTSSGATTSAGARKQASGLILTFDPLSAGTLRMLESKDH